MLERETGGTFAPHQAAKVPLWARICVSGGGGGGGGVIKKL